jgi:phenylpropionate dioxygenase-like ring-hydroxylating dioxygenase large terminal subunit
MSATAGITTRASEDLSDAVTYDVAAYISEDYARAERDKLWRRVWQQVGRVEDIPEVGDYITYEILDDSILVVRAGANEIRAYHNVCAHRGSRLVRTHGAKERRGRARAGFVCVPRVALHLKGENANVIHKPDWKGALTDDCIGLRKVDVDTWSGWIFINMDPECEPLRDYLEPAASMLEPFQLQHMRTRWRKWGVFDCNWKVAMEAFYETYHVQTTHPEFNKFGEFRGWAECREDTATSATTRRRTWTRTSRQSCGLDRAPTPASRLRRCRSIPGRKRTPTRRRRSSMRRSGWSTSCRKELPATKCSSIGSSPRGVTMPHAA